VGRIVSMGKDTMKGNGDFHLSNVVQGIEIFMGRMPNNIEAK
jgi:hypothetical protein